MSALELHSGSDRLAVKDIGFALKSGEVLIEVKVWH
jgi:hypothetical protein